MLPEQVRMLRLWCWEDAREAWEGGLGWGGWGWGDRAAWSGPQEVASELRAGLLLGESLFTQWPCFLGQN